jgi:glycosyltransferase involved in cell wall biosynthesis
VRQHRRATAGANRNLGVAESRGRLLLFVDADDTANDRYVDAMATALESHELVCSAVDLELLNPWDPSGTHPQQTGLIQSMDFLPFAGAGTLGVRRSLFEERGEFDLLLRCYEDADLCWRIQLSGHEPQHSSPMPNSTYDMNVTSPIASRLKSTRDARGAAAGLTSIPSALRLSVGLCVCS